MIAGADSIGDMDLLRHGGMSRLVERSTRFAVGPATGAGRRRAQGNAAFENFRTPRFDLDSVTAAARASHRGCTRRTTRDKLLIGNTPSVSGDLPRNHEGVALIGDPLPAGAGWEIQWSRFFDGLPTSAAGHTQVARAFAPKLSAAFSALPPSIDRSGRPLALFNSCAATPSNFQR
ncbi:MAG: hypothetical protein KY451_05040 [Actinobacteria bacterium]|nr:hypothetical protein [Actinomycetota bacterium]MBW3646487.1 hypothetical protein [Actinomycetota bacterium]